MFKKLFQHFKKNIRPNTGFGFFRTMSEMTDLGFECSQNSVSRKLGLPPFRPGGMKN